MGASGQVPATFDLSVDEERGLLSWQPPAVTSEQDARGAGPEARAPGAPTAWVTPWMTIESLELARAGGGTAASAGVAGGGARAYRTRRLALRAATLSTDVAHLDAALAGAHGLAAAGLGPLRVWSDARTVKLG